MAPQVAEKTAPGRTESATAESTETAVTRDELVWDAQFAASRDVLEDLYDEITADHEAGRTTPVRA